jgi:motility quorum-sensing regulator / GCU-specific mRNA interferase toxin
VEKKKPSHDLKAFQMAFSRERAITLAAARSARALGFSVSDVVVLVKRLERKHFFKSMTSVHDHRQWQDVYHLPDDDRILYLKFTDAVVTEFVLLSFKEKLTCA